MSVAALVCRPTGPAATEALAPSVSLPLAMPSTPLRVLKTRMTSVESMPPCQPRLPPVSLMNAGLLHELSSCRTTRTPLPCRAPSPKAARTTPGMTATAYARDNRLGGIDFSGMRDSWSTTSAASATRFSSRVAAKAEEVKARASTVTAATKRLYFILFSDKSIALGFDNTSIH